MTQTEKQWDAGLYDSNYSFVWKNGEEMIGLLAPRAGERILDLGCGTGHLTKRIAEAGANVIGMDRSPAMLEKARGSYNRIPFVMADAAEFAFAVPFDAVFSNAVLHWVKRQASAAECIARALKPGGRFVAEFGGAGNLTAIYAALHEVFAALSAEDGGPQFRVHDEELRLYYPTIGHYSGLLEAHGFGVTYAVLFDRLTPLEGGAEGLRGWMKMFTPRTLEQLSPNRREKYMQVVEQLLRPTLFRDGTWYADYRRIRVVARRV